MLDQRIDQLEADINELKNALGTIQTVQIKILENDRKLFEIHEHNDKWLKEVQEGHERRREILNGLLEEHSQLNLKLGRLEERVSELEPKEYCADCGEEIHGAHGNCPGRQ